MDNKGGFLAVVFLSISILTGVVSADLVRGIDIDFVPIGNVGNPAHTAQMSDGTTGYGDVDYGYRIGKYEVTNSQWDHYASMAAPAQVGDSFFLGDQIPVTKVSWFEAMQFCNWLTSGNKLTGVYEFHPTHHYFQGVIDREAALSAYGKIYALPTEDEWYKAAYYDGSEYKSWSSSSNTVLDGWNYRGTGPGKPRNAGIGPEDLNGTYDMMGNVWEWTEARYIDQVGISHTVRRGGSFTSTPGLLGNLWRQGDVPNAELSGIGFRIVEVVPEPTTILLLGVGGLALRTKR